MRLNPLGSNATLSDTVVEVRKRQAALFRVPTSSIDITMVNSKGYLTKVMDLRNMLEDEDGEEQTMADVLMSERGPEENLETVLEEVSTNPPIINVEVVRVCLPLPPSSPFPPALSFNLFPFLVPPTLCLSADLSIPPPPSPPSPSLPPCRPTSTLTWSGTRGHSLCGFHTTPTSATCRA